MNHALLKTAHRYTGQVEDASVGLYWYASRAYDVSIGRFAQPDTIVPNAGNPQALNRYSYVANNPLRYSDPTGRDPWYEEDSTRDPHSQALTVTPVPTPSATPMPTPQATPQPVPRPTPIPDATPTPTPGNDYGAQVGGTLEVTGFCLATQSGHYARGFRVPSDSPAKSFVEAVAEAFGMVAGAQVHADVAVSGTYAHTENGGWLDLELTIRDPSMNFAASHLGFERPSIDPNPKVVVYSGGARATYDMKPVVVVTSASDPVWVYQYSGPVPSGAVVTVSPNIGVEGLNVTGTYSMGGFEQATYSLP